jgi:hypothetical protein
LPDFLETLPEFLETFPDFLETLPEILETSPDFQVTMQKESLYPFLPSESAAIVPRREIHE